MPNLLIDPVIVCTPDSKDPEVLRNWLELIDSWVSELKSSPYNWFFLAKSMAAIQSGGIYPTFSFLREALLISEADISLPAISRTISEFFLKEECDLSSETEVSVVVYESAEILPKTLLERIPDEAGVVLLDGLVHLAVCSNRGDESLPDVKVITKSIDGRNVEVKADLIACEPEHSLGTVNGRFPLVFVPQDMKGVISALDVLELGENELVKAIERESIASYGGVQKLKVRLNSNFWNSLADSGIRENVTAIGKLIRVGAAVSCERASELKLDLRHLRVSKAAKSPQRKRNVDNALAWRITVVTSGVGWRLHFWRVPSAGGDVIEFANVLKKQDSEVIPD